MSNKASIAINFFNNVIGNKQPACVIAGPCSIESAAQIDRIAASVAASGATVLRGGAYKPRTSPQSFQGLGAPGYKMLNNSARKYGLACIAEVIDSNSLAEAVEYIDIIQIGARNMYNYSLLKEIGKVATPILLKRGLTATYQEWLLAAEYIISHGNPNVILCERGIRTFETYTRNTLDLAAVPVMRELCQLPIVIDPSHGTGKRSLVPAMSKAALALDVDGLMLEVHYEPENSISDAAQTISTTEFENLMLDIKDYSCIK